MKPAVGGILVLAALAAGWPARGLIRRLAVPAARGTAPEPGTARAASGPAPLAVGLCTAVLFAGLTARAGPGLVLAAYCWLAVTTVPLAWIDAAVHRLPDVLTGAAYAGTVLLLLVAAVVQPGDWVNLQRAVAGGLALMAAYFVLAIIRAVSMGLGDVKLSASLGTALAWTGWGTLLAGVLAGLVLAACYGAVLLATHRARLGQQIPLGPALIAGTFLVLMAVGPGSHVH
jgi:leader peptidase (prepilin peptidase) / N-methyltransferase